MRNFFSLTIHGITDSWSRKEFVLAVEHFPGSHTGKKISEIISTILNRWEIGKASCHCFLRDSGSNMKKVNYIITLLHFKH